MKHSPAPVVFSPRAGQGVLLPTQPLLSPASNVSSHSSQSCMGPAGRSNQLCQKYPFPWQTPALSPSSPPLPSLTPRLTTVWIQPPPWLKTCSCCGAWLGDGDFDTTTRRVMQPEGGGPVPLCHPLWLPVLEPLPVQGVDAKKYNEFF